MVNADLAMYNAKEDGRDRIAAYSVDDRAHARMKGRVTWARAHPRRARGGPTSPC